MNTPIILLHGLGVNEYSLLPLKLTLLYYGYNAHSFTYPVDKLDFDETFVNKDEPVILIGQSMGGVVANNLHKKDWNVKHAIYIGSPLHGARLITQIESKIPTWLRNKLYKKPYEFLQNKDREQIPPHPYQTVTMGWFNSTFDGCVYQDEAVLDHEQNTHLYFADHRTIFANPRLWFLIKRMVDNLD